MPCESHHDRNHKNSHWRAVSALRLAPLLRWRVRLDLGAQPAWLDKARLLAEAEDPHRLWSLQALATELGVHVRTLRDAARSGRLAVTYENRVVFGNVVPSATRAAGRAFIERYYRRSYSRFAQKPPARERTRVPSDWARRLLCVRRELGLTQARLAEQIGAAGKAVVYQWESRKRRPSPVFWLRIERLQRRVTAPTTI